MSVQLAVAHHQELPLQLKCKPSNRGDGVISNDTPCHGDGWSSEMSATRPAFWLDRILESTESASQQIKRVAAQVYARQEDVTDINNFIQEFIGWPFGGGQSGSALVRWLQFFLIPVTLTWNILRLFTDFLPLVVAISAHRLRKELFGDQPHFMSLLPAGVLGMIEALATLTALLSGAVTAPIQSAVLASEVSYRLAALSMVVSAVAWTLAIPFLVLPKLVLALMAWAPAFAMPLMLKAASFIPAWVFDMVVYLSANVFNPVFAPVVTAIAKVVGLTLPLVLNAFIPTVFGLGVLFTAVAIVSSITGIHHQEAVRAQQSREAREAAQHEERIALANNVAAESNRAAVEAAEANRVREENANQAVVSPPQTATNQAVAREAAVVPAPVPPAVVPQAARPSTVVVPRVSLPVASAQNASVMVAPLSARVIRALSVSPRIPSMTLMFGYVAAYSAAMAERGCRGREDSTYAMELMSLIFFCHIIHAGLQLSAAASRLFSQPRQPAPRAPTAVPAMTAQGELEGRTATSIRPTKSVVYHL